MRKSAVAIGLLLLALAFYWLAKREDLPQPTTTANTEDSAATNPAATSPNAEARPKWTRPNRPTAGEGNEENANNAFVYGPAEFGRGEMQNVVIDGGIKLGNDPAFVPRFNPKYRLFGNYISPEEELQAPATAANVNFQVTSLNNNEATFEIRTRGSDGNWSEWREVSTQAMKEPFSFGSEAVAWQYRVTLFANDAASSPKVEAVAIEPLSNRR